MKIALQTLASGLFGVAFFVVLLFWPAGTLNYWQTPLALDSYWGLLATILALPILTLRIDDEEKMLHQELDGYDEYTQKVHYRLVPGVW